MSDKKGPNELNEPQIGAEEETLAEGERAPSPAPSTPSTSPSSTMASIGQRIRRARLNRNLTQGELAKNAFSISYVSAVERGQIRPSLGALERLATRLSVSVSDLLTQSPDDDFVGTYTFTEHGPDYDARREAIAAKLREAQIASRQGKTEGAITLLHELLQEATAPRDLAAAHVSLAACYAAAEQWDQAREELQAAMPLAERIGDRELLERARYELGTVYAAMGQHLLALECHRTGYEAIRRQIMRDPLYRLNVLSSLGHDYWELGEYDKAVDVLKEAADLANDVLNPERLGDLYALLWAAYAAQGESARAKRAALSSIRAYEEVGNKKQASYVHGRLGRAYLQANQLEDAEVHLTLAHDMAQKLDDPKGIAMSSRSLSELHRRRQQNEEAERAAQDAVAAAERQRDSVARAEALLALGQALEASGQPREADAQITQAVDLFERAASPHQRSGAYHELAALYKQRHDADKAYAYLEKAWLASSRGQTR